MSRGQARRGTAASTACARSPVVRSGRRATMNCAIRRAQRSSPYSRRIRSSSAPSESLTTAAAVSSAPGSMRMSSGPPARKLNPRSGSSIWVLERPKSKRTRSAGLKPCRDAIAPSSEKRPWTTTADIPNEASDSRTAATAAGSRSIPSSRPPGVILSRSWRAWPACPSVQSIAIAPARGWSSSITSCESAGTCGLMSRDHPVSELCEPSLRVGAVAVPPGLGPDLHARAGPDHDHGRRRLDPRQPALFREQADPSLAVRLERIGERIERARQGALIRSRQRALELLAQGRPQVRRIDRQHLVLADGHVASVLQLFAEHGRDRQPALVVHSHPMSSSEQRSPAPPHVLAVVGRSGVEEVYGVPYQDVGCDVCFHVCLVHHFSPLINAIRRRPYQRWVILSIPLPLDLDTPNPLFYGAPHDLGPVPDMAPRYRGE